MTKMRDVTSVPPKLCGIRCDMLAEADQPLLVTCQMPLWQGKRHGGQHRADMAGGGHLKWSNGPARKRQQVSV